MKALVVSATEASRLLATDPHTVLEMLDRGELPGYREGRNWKIPLKLLDAYVEDRALKESRERRKIYEEVQVEQTEVLD